MLKNASIGEMYNALTSKGIKVPSDSGFEDVIVIESIYGLGEAIVRGEEIPDEFFNEKNGFKRA
jgi:phosphoenolpyruvate synthase/pyruvate phosphate dikinase